MMHTIDIRGDRTPDGCSQLVRGRIAIHAGSPELDAQIRAIYRRADLQVYALFGGDAEAARRADAQRGDR